MEAIILAGGLGTRLGALTEKIPKAMLPVRNRPFLELIFDYWEAQGVTRFVLALGHLCDSIKSHFGKRYKKAELVYSIEDRALGTGGALLLAQKQLKSKSPFLVTNGDTFFEVRLSALEKFHAAKQAACSIALFKISSQDRYGGVQLADDGKILSFSSTLSEKDTSYLRGGTGLFANGGVYLMNQDWAKGCESHVGEKISIESEVFPRMATENKALFGFVSESRFIDIGTPADYERSQQLLSKGVA
jgi:D-glycero-alpha-D-manno-heptose 1-phosphate guanylyltransferase